MARLIRTPLDGILTFVLVALSAASCIGDQGYSVALVSEAARPLTVIEEGVRERPSRFTLDPGQKEWVLWRTPAGERDARRATVRALDASGELVFCQQFSYADVQRVRFEVRIREGALLCEVSQR